MIEDEKSGYLFQTGDSVGLANKLESIFSKENKDISKNALAASERYNPKNVVDETIEFYKSLV